MRLGIVANEFFDQRLGRMGGFGWAARQAARCFDDDPSLGIRPVLISAEPLAEADLSEDTRLLRQTTTRIAYLRSIRSERLDLLLTIDYRPSYLPIFAGLPRTPLLVWSRDPRSRSNQQELDTLRIPGRSGRPAWIDPIETRSLAWICRASTWVRRPLRVTTTAPETLSPRAADAYGLALGRLPLLPNPIELPPRSSERATPRVLFLGRLDPVKRPWLFVELARSMPNVEFMMLGDAQVRDPGRWTAERAPANLRLLGHVNEAEKAALLASAWVLVNTSVHEALPVSFLEALAAETPLVSCQDPEEVVSRFGIYVGRHPGHGLEAVPALADSVGRLLEDHPQRIRLGHAGRAWVASTHTRERFIAAFLGLCSELGVNARARQR